MLEIWQLCEGNHRIKTIECKAWRIVENQNQTATRKLVDSLQEQEILEDLIESHKPALPKSCQIYHYLLATPFRYPPLKHGSRFGTRYEPSLWYGSLSIETALAEKAYYRFRFLRASEADYAELPIKYSAFLTKIKTKQGIDLTVEPFSNYEQEISRPDSYVISQKLGNQMRNDKIEAFCFKSARCPEKGKNLALFVPKGFRNKEPIEPFQDWQETVINDKSHIEFVRTNCLRTESKQFALNLFTIDGKLPYPAE